MKISVSLPQDDIDFVDEYAARTQAGSRSAVIHAAIELLRAAELEADYTAAFEEWDGSEDAALWEQTTGDRPQLHVRIPPETGSGPRHAEPMTLTPTPTPTRWTARPIDADALTELRDTDDAGRPCTPYTDTEGGAPLRCCLRASAVGERIALVSYAPLRRWAAETWAKPGAYDEQGPVFIHAEECEGPRSSEAYPLARPGALRVIRRYNAEGHIVGGRLLEIPETAAEGFDAAFAEAFADPEVALLHVRAVEYGCFHFEVRR